MQPSHPLHIVGIGASAGGLEAMVKLLSHTHANGRIAYVVAQHMAKDGHIELVLRQLNRGSRLPVVVAKSNDKLEADTVYVIPPACIGVLQQGRIQLLPVTADYISSPSVNALFNSMAKDAGTRAIGVILSGTGTDGTAGCRAIKAYGGETLAQDPKTAQFAGMPAAAIEVKAADQVMDAEDIGRHLSAMFPAINTPLAALPRLAPIASPSPLPGILSVLVQAVFDATGVDFSSYKEETLLRRIDRRMITLNIATLEQYQRHALQNEQELHVLQHLFLVSLSSFFRDRPAFDVVRSNLTRLVAQKSPGDAIRIWVPGCASGEECYTYAIMLAEILQQQHAHFNVDIIGSDLNPEALAIAREGLYRQTAFKETEPGILAQYFEHKGQHYQVKPAIRDACQFIRQDVVGMAAPGKLDVVSCRNLLIYMKSNLQDQLFRQFHQALLPEGLLFIGQSENIGLLGNSMFTPVDHYHRLYRRKN